MMPGTWQGNTYCLAPEQTLHTLNGLNMAVRAFPGNRCVLDASQVTEMDSIGVAALVHLYRVAHDAGVELILQGMNARLARLLRLYALDPAAFGQMQSA